MWQSPHHGKAIQKNTNKYNPFPDLYDAKDKSMIREASQ
jgi:hypothetical protein